jgi:hypothetical protein
MKLASCQPALICLLYPELIAAKLAVMLRSSEMTFGKCSGILGLASIADQRLLARG